MCGIAAVSAKNISFDGLDFVLDHIRHRGPDDKGNYISNNRDVALGFVRLSILDLSKFGSQPMSDNLKMYTIVFNGEIYNYRELKKYLEDRYNEKSWKSSSDSEVILKGLNNEGIKFFSKLNGIFTIAAYNRLKNILHVIRDPLGVKPLFYTKQNGYYFCSELKGLLKFPNLKRSVRMNSFGDQLAFTYVPEPFTLYNEFFKVTPGVCYTYKNGILIKEQSLYDKLHSKIDFKDENEMQNIFSEGFENAVNRQLVSDVPVSIFLSGGLDSSAIAYQAKKHTDKIKEAYTISFKEEDKKYDMQSDDLFYAKLIARKLGLKLRVIEAEDSFLELINQLIPFMEDGFTDPASINTFLISKHAREAGYKVMLSGQGADEYLGGYRRYLAEKYLSKIPKFFMPAIWLLKFLPSYKGRFNSVARRMKKLASLSQNSQLDRLYNLYSWTSKSDINSLLLEQVSWSGEQDFKDYVNQYTNDEIIETMMKVDHQYDLLSLNLTYTDRMSMAVGVEVRVPFLDFELINIMNSIPNNMKIRRNETKYILKKSMEGKIPNNIIYREKAGFSLPIRSWIRKDSKLFAKYFDHNRLKKQGIFNPNKVKEMYAEFLHGNSDNAYTLFTLYCQQIWCEQNQI